MVRTRIGSAAHRLTRVVGVGAVLGLVLVVAAPSAAWAHAPSDTRASFVQGSASTCSALGFPSDTQVGGTTAGASDSNIKGVIQTNEGSVQPGTGQELDVTILGSPKVVVDAILVSGSSDSYNKYIQQQYLPPTLQPNQHYIPPLTSSGGSVNSIDQWFVCYNTSGVPMPTGATGFAGGAVVAGVALFGLTWMSRRRRSVVKRQPS
jgi:hypothetical protein